MADKLNNYFPVYCNRCDQWNDIIGSGTGIREFDCSYCGKYLVAVFYNSGMYVNTSGTKSL